jgi:outer membrane receptor protein involved in Fe transport
MVLEFLDLERVEVTNPLGLLYGRNALGGEST